LSVTVATPVSLVIVTSCWLIEAAYLCRQS